MSSFTRESVDLGPGWEPRGEEHRVYEGGGGGHHDC